MEFRYPGLSGVTAGLGCIEIRIEGSGFRVLVPRPEWGQRRGAAAALTSLVAPRQGPMAGVLV